MRRYGFCGLIIVLCFCVLSNVLIAAVGWASMDGIVDLSGEHAGYTGVGYLDTTNAIGSGGLANIDYVRMTGSGIAAVNCQ